MTTDTLYDALVIGGGPAGASTATLLAQRGYSVLLLEREHFPRFHIGESLIPCCMPLFERLGVADALEHEGFLVKHGAEFVSADGSEERLYPFDEGVVSGPGFAYEVERDRFDQILLAHAKQQGVEVLEGVSASGFSQSSSHIEVVAQNGSATQTFRARMLIDASGQGGFVARLLGLKQMDPELRNFAVFAHYEGARRHSGRREGDISIVLVPEGWWWVIPLRNDRTSVGRVAPARSLKGQKADTDFFERELRGAPYLAERFAGARRLEPVRSAADYTYRSQQLAGDRWLAVGDAAAFIDPVFSTGVFLGLRAAERAATSVDAALRQDKLTRKAFRGYERWLTQLLHDYDGFVKGFYTPEFAEVMMRPSDRMQLRQAVTSLLAGHSLQRWPIGWRIGIFRSITRLNRFFELAPRLPGRREAAAGLSRVP